MVYVDRFFQQQKTDSRLTQGTKRVPLESLETSSEIKDWFANEEYDYG